MNTFLILHKTTQLRPQPIHIEKYRPNSIRKFPLTFVASGQTSVPNSPRDKIMNEACDRWWQNRMDGNADYTPPWISLPDELNSVRNEHIRKVNFENQSPVEVQDDL